MKLIYQDNDIMEDVSINGLIHEMYAEARSDVLDIRFNDPKSVWEEWDPKIGETIELRGETAKTGVMYISSITAKNGLYTVRALSMPSKCKIVSSKSWDEVKFPQIVQEIAARHEMEYEIHGVSEIVYPYMVQDSVDDLEFLQHLCELEGCAMLAYNGKMVIYDEKSLEETSPLETLSIGLDGVFNYVNNSAFLYSSAEVRGGGYKGTFRDISIQNDRVYKPDWPVFINNDNEAHRYAKNLLRSVNKNMFTGTIERDLSLNYTPASVIKLETVKAKTWNGSIFITRVRHDYMKKSTKLYFRKPLEGY